PPSDACAGCGMPSLETIEGAVVCESPVSSIGGDWLPAVGWIASFLGALLFGWIIYFRRDHVENTIAEGSHVEAPLCVALCNVCEPTGWNTARKAFRILKWLSVVVGIGFLYVTMNVGLGLLAGAALFWILEAKCDGNIQRVLREALENVPVYAAVLQEYPDASIVYE
ncbi:MAG: hypothetical protein N2C14_23155, partial [Planctomycetales bacterium]